jgi:hypothetical protein
MSETTPLNELPLKHLQELEKIAMVAYCVTSDPVKEKIYHDLAVIAKAAIKDLEVEKDTLPY